MFKKIHKIKLISILIIMTLFLIPLISSPAAAQVNYNAGTGTSTNTNPPAAPTVVITPSPPGAFPGGTPPLFVTFMYTFIDANTGPAGSNHICTLDVINLNTGVATVASTGWVTVPKGGTISGVLTTPPIPFIPPAPGNSVVFSITAYMKVIDNNNPARSASGSGSTTVTIT